MEEQFKDFEFDGMKYKVGNFGTVYGTRFKRPLKQRINGDGYLTVTLGKLKGKRTSIAVHRLVAMLFVPNDDPDNKKEVNHIDYNRQNPRYDNLEWITHVDNIRHSSNAGRFSDSKKGIKNGRSKYSEEEVLKIRELYKLGYTVMDIVKEFYPELNSKERHNKWSTIKRIVTNECYNDI